MTQTKTVISSVTDSAKAGTELGQSIVAAFDGAAADAVIVFASAQHDFPVLLEALARASGTETIVGSSSAGEFTEQSRAEGGVCAMGLRSRDMRFSVGVGRNLSASPQAAAAQVASTFVGATDRTLAYRAALVMTDALAGHTDAVVEELTIRTAGNYTFFGGGAGDDGRFLKTHVFAGTKTLSDAVVALEILSSKPLGVGVSHGWIPAGDKLRVTETDGMRLVGLNGAPAMQAFEDHAAATGQTLDVADPLPFFLHNILGIDTAEGIRLRVPLGVNPDGSISCAAAIPDGAIVQIMKTTAESAVLAARQAVASALEGIGSHKPGAALVFDCVATRLRLGRAFGDELAACNEMLAPASYVGCNTYGQIARADGQFGGFHNCTAVVCVLPE